MHEFSSRGIRAYDFDMQRSAIDVCASVYGPHVAPNPNAYTERYGGYRIGDGKVEGLTNLIFSNGGLDPWYGGGFLPEYAPEDAEERGLYYFFMEKAAHHLDLRGPHKDDPEEVTKVREMEEKIIEGWINDYAHGK